MIRNKTSITIRDNKNIKNIFIQINLKNNTTLVFSNFSSWENLAYIMEALAVTVQKCIQEGISKRKIYFSIKDYLTKILGNYEIINSGEKLK